jgi:hypothetical protein
MAAVGFNLRMVYQVDRVHSFEKIRRPTEQINVLHLNSDLFENIQLIQCHAGTSYDRGKGIISDRDRKARFLSNQEIKTSQQRASTG